jgi:fucose permease
VTAARVAVSVIFFLHGVASGMWVSRIPAVQEQLGLSLATLGLALLGGGLGSLLAMLPMGVVISRAGSRRVALGAGLGASGAFVLLALADSGWTLFGALLVWGATIGTLDVAMNAQGSAIEQRRARPIMSSLHGLWSVGSMSGAAVGALLAALAISPRIQFLAAAPVLAIAVTVGTRRFVSDREQAAKRPFVWPRGALLPLATMVFCAVAVEGAMFDWSGVFVRRTLDASEGIAAAAPTFFAAAMALGRLVGDPVTVRVSGPTLARGSAVLAAIGLGLVVVAPWAELVFGALMLVGLGLAVLVPLAFSAAGRSPSMPTSTAIAAVATVGYSAFLFAPPAIGLIAEQFTLRGSFVLLLLLLVVIVLLAPAVQSRSG